MAEVRVSVLSGLSRYARDLVHGLSSVTRSSLTALPYLLGVGDLRKEVTEQYPDPVSARTPDDLPPRTRGLLVNDIERCTGCGDCARICPADCIRIQTEAGPAESKTWVSVFDIDFSLCAFCGLCVEVCAPTSLVHTRRYEMSAYRPGDLVSSFGKGILTPEQRQRWAAARKQEGVEGTLT